MKGEQFPNTPAMIGDPGYHHGRPLDTRPTGCRLRQSHACIRRAKVVDDSARVHVVPHRAGLAHQRTAPPCQRRESRATRGVEARDGGCVAHPVALQAVPPLLHPCGRPLHAAALARDHPPLLVPRDDLHAEEPSPAATSGTAARSGAHRVAAGLTDGTEVGTPPIRTAQEDAWQRTRAHPCE